MNNGTKVKIDCTSVGGEIKQALDGIEGYVVDSRNNASEIKVQYNNKYGSVKSWFSSADLKEIK